MSVKYISGPTSIVRMKSDMYDKDIYLVSDKHDSLSGMCKPDKNTEEFHLYIDKIFKENPDKSFDYFIEEGFFVKKNIDIKSNKSYLKKTISYFNEQGCFSMISAEQKKCRTKYSNVRFHLTDARVNKQFYKIKKEENSLNNIRKMIRLSEDSEENIYKNIKIVKKILLSLRYKKKFNDSYRELWKTKLISSQYDKIKDKKIKSKIKKYFDSQWKKIIVEDFKNNMGKIKKNMSDEEAYKIFTSISLTNMIIRLNSIYMDIYLILRLFKDFDNDPAKNIIIHAGSYHIINYINFFKFLEFSIKKTTKNKTKRCLDISDINFF